MKTESFNKSAINGRSGMSDFPREERRRECRRTQQRAAQTVFYNRGEPFQASLVDLSAGGARLELNNGNTPAALPELYPGRQMECYITTPLGRSKCRGTVRWMHDNNGRLEWGISFIELSPANNDPLRTVIEQGGSCDDTYVITPG